MMSLAEELSDCCNSVIYFIITLKGTGEEPESLRWMDFSFSNLIVFCFVFCLVFMYLHLVFFYTTLCLNHITLILDIESVALEQSLRHTVTISWSIV